MRYRAIALAFVMVMSLAIAGVSGSSVISNDDNNVTDLGADHDLNTADAVNAFANDGVAEADIERIDMTVTVADNKDDVGLEEELLPTNQFNDFVRFEYREEADRTIRILIPDEYWTPYERERLESINSDHQADFESVRGGDYQSVVIRFDGPGEAVFPAEWVASFSYQNLERIDDRLNNSIGLTIRDDNSQWTYVNTTDMAEGPGLEIDEDIEDLTVQYDATPDSPEETWINAPEGETFSDDIYYYQRESENGSVFIVSKTDNPPNVRYNVDSTLTDRIRGNLNAIKNIPNKIGDILGGDLLG
ncbi:hypothetical protein ACLI4U_19000 (plasmid) [Natrialbaceae archaeon A-CW2]